MELPRPSTARQLGRDRVDPLGDDQYRSIDSFREKVSQRAVETARQHDSLAILSDEGKGPLEIEYSGNVASEKPTSSVGFVNRSGSCRLFGNQVDDAGNGQLLIHVKKIPPVRCRCYNLSQRCAVRCSMPMALPREVSQIVLHFRLR
jgi:hypothetical protein